MTTTGKIALFVGGTLFGSAGFKLLGSKDARKVYTHTTAAVLRCKDQEPDGMWANFKKQQKELEKLYDKKMKEREEAEKKYRKRKNPQESKDTKPAANNEARKKDKKK